MLAEASAIRLRWLSEPAAWHPHWGVAHSRMGKQLRALFVVLSTPAAEDADESPDEQLPTELRLVMQLTNAFDPATCQPGVVFRFALVNRNWAGWVRARLRSSVMAPFWIRMAVGMVRPGAVLHPELLTRHTLRDWLQLEFQFPHRAQLSEWLPPPKMWLSAQRWAELFAHFCNVDDDQCQWSGWMRLGFRPYINPDGTAASRTHPGRGPATPAESVRESISDWMVHSGAAFHHEVGPGEGDGPRLSHTALGRTVSKLLHTLDLPPGDSIWIPSGYPCLIEMMRVFAALFPQQSDYDLATGFQDSDERDGDTEPGTPVPCRWAESVSTLSPAEAAKVNTPWTRFPDRRFSQEELEASFQVVRSTYLQR